MATQNAINTLSPIEVGKGGTGAATLTDHGVLLGSGTGAITALAEASDGQLVVGSTGNDPVLATITAGNNIGITNAAGSITVDVNGTTQYALQVGDATNSLDSLAIGSANQMLQSGGAGANPAWSTATYPATTTQGDVIYSSADNTVAGLAKDTNATRYISNTGASNNPAWAQINLANGVTGTLTVPNGGTGATTLTDHGLMLGSGTGAVTVLAEATDGQLPIGSTGNDPVLATITAGNNIGITNAAGSITVNVNGTTQYALQVGDATNSLDSLAIGTANQILQSGGAGANPAWSTATYPATTAQGDVIYSSAANTVASLAKDTNATRYLANTGASNNPAWDQINLANGVTGTLPVTNGGMGAATFTDGGVLVGSGTSAVTALTVGTDGQVLVGSSAADPVFATLASSDGSITYATGAGTLGLTVTQATTGQLGGSTLATTAEVTTGTDTSKIVTAAGVAAKLGTQTDHGVLVGSGSTNAVTALAVGTDGQVLLGSTGADPVFATLASSGSTIAFTPGAGTLNLETGSAVCVSVTTDSGSAVPSSGVLTIAGAGTVSTSGAGSTVTITGAGGGGISWNEVTGTSQAMAVNNGYILNNAALVTATLPSTAAVGDVIRVVGLGDGGWKIAQNASQYIQWDEASTTTTGVGGSLDSTDDHDAVELLCTVTNNGWSVLSSKGNISIT